MKLKNKISTNSHLNAVLGASNRKQGLMSSIAKKVPAWLILGGIMAVYGLIAIAELAN